MIGNEPIPPAKYNIEFKGCIPRAPPRRLPFLAHQGIIPSETSPLDKSASSFPCSCGYCFIVKTIPSAEQIFFRKTFKKHHEQPRHLSTASTVYIGSNSLMAGRSNSWWQMTTIIRPTSKVAGRDYDENMAREDTRGTKRQQLNQVFVQTARYGPLPLHRHALREAVKWRQSPVDTPVGSRRYPIAMDDQRNPGWTLTPYHTGSILSDSSISPRVASLEN